MLMTLLNRAVGKWLLPAFFAVLFYSTGWSQDNFLVKFDSSLSELVYNLSQSVVTVESYYSLHDNTRDLVEDEAVYNVIVTGIIFDSSGHVLTMVSPLSRESKIQVRFEDRVIPAELEAVDYQNGLALLKMAQPVGRPVTMSPQHGCAGQMVVALGNSYEFRAATSIGFCAGVRPDGIVQFTAPISSGTVGGGLFDLSGQLIGLIAGRVDQQDGTHTGLAVPAFELFETGNYLIKKGTRTAGYLGLSTAEIEIFPPLEISQSNRLTTSQSPDIIVDRGVVITSVVPSSPAARAGLKVGDLLFAMNKQTLPSALQLASFVKQSEPGTIIEFGVMRQNRPYYVPVRIGQVDSQTVRTSLSFSFESVQTVSPGDSLVREIERLRETIDALERRLKEHR